MEYFYLHFSQPLYVFYAAPAAVSLYFPYFSSQYMHR